MTWWTGSGDDLYHPFDPQPRNEQEAREMCEPGDWFAHGEFMELPKDFPFDWQDFDEKFEEHYFDEYFSTYITKEAGEDLMRGLNAFWSEWKAKHKPGTNSIDWTIHPEQKPVPIVDTPVDPDDDSPDAS